MLIIKTPSIVSLISVVGDVVIASVIISGIVSGVRGGMPS